MLGFFIRLSSIVKMENYVAILQARSLIHVVTLAKPAQPHTLNTLLAYFHSRTSLFGIFETLELAGY